jgi:hypothetical protein
MNTVSSSLVPRCIYITRVAPYRGKQYPPDPKAA